MRRPIAILSVVSLLVLALDAYLWVQTLTLNCGLCNLGPFILLVGSYPLLGFFSAMSAGVLALIYAIRQRHTIWAVVLALMLVVSASLQYWIVGYVMGVWPQSLLSRLALPSMLVLPVLALVSTWRSGQALAS